MTAQAGDGELVQVKDHRTRLLGVGFYNSKSKINVRVLAPDRVEVDQNFFDERIRAALAVRQRHLPNASSFRVVNAESDFLTGLIVDKYEDVIVIQISALGMDKRKPLIVAVLQKIFSPRAIMERSDVASRKFEGLLEANGLIAGEKIFCSAATMSGLRFSMPSAEIWITITSSYLSTMRPVRKSLSAFTTRNDVALGRYRLRTASAAAMRSSKKF